MNRKNMNLTNGNDVIAIPENCKNDLIKAMNIGYYKEFYKQGLITAEQLELLIAMQDKRWNSLFAFGAASGQRGNSGCEQPQWS